MPIEYADNRDSLVNRFLQIVSSMRVERFNIYYSLHKYTFNLPCHVERDPLEL